MIFPQQFLDLHGEIIVDGFAGGGGASCGIELGLGRMVDKALNHADDASAMHRLNHPHTQHFVADIFETDPRTVTEGRPVGLAWFSPDCTYHSKARGGKPIRHANRKRRALAWVVKRWGAQVAPRVVMMENVEEFPGWCALIAKRDRCSCPKGPARSSRRGACSTCGATGRVLCLVRDPVTGEVLKDGSKDRVRVAEPGERIAIEDQQLVPDPRRTGETYRQWKRDLEAVGYVVETRELRACDFGAPTIRNRWFLVARRDGRPIVWPAETHGDPATEAVKGGRLLPWRTAAECIDWSIPMLSIFATREEAKAWAAEQTPTMPAGLSKVEAKAWRKANRVFAPQRPLALASMRRMARGVMRYVVNAAKPFVVTLNHGGGRDHAPRGIDEPFRTVNASRDAHGLVVPVIAGLGGRAGDSPERPVDRPFQTVTAKADSGLVAAHLAPVVVEMAHGEVSPGGVQRWGSGARSAEAPLPTVTGSGVSSAVGVAHLAPFVTEHANASSQRNMPADEPMRTQCADVKGGHFALVAPYMVPRYGEAPGQEPRAASVEQPMPVVVPTGNGASLVAANLVSYHAEKSDGDARGSALDEPVSTLDTANRVGLVAAFLAQNNYNEPGHAATEPMSTIVAKGCTQSLVAASLMTNTTGHAGAAADEPVPTVTTGPQQAVVAAHISNMQGHDPDGGDGDPAQPARTVTGHGKAALVYAFLQKFYGTDQDPRIDQPLHTATTKDRFGLVTVTVLGILMVITDIAMRMFRPRELYRAQGFPDSYVIDRGLWPDGSIRPLTQEEQVRMCGNSVPPPFAAALAAPGGWMRRSALSQLRKSTWPTWWRCSAMCAGCCAMTGRCGSTLGTPTATTPAHRRSRAPSKAMGQASSGSPTKKRCSSAARSRIG